MNNVAAVLNLLMRQVINGPLPRGVESYCEREISSRKSSNKHLHKYKSGHDIPCNLRLRDVLE